MAPTVAFVSFRLGGSDGVAVVARQWSAVFAASGWTVRTVAGEGPVDVVLPGLTMGADSPPPAGEVHEALADVDLVIVENLCSLPLNPAAADVVAAALTGRPAILHHHDLPWQRDRFAHLTTFVPDDPAWRHVTINELSRRQLAERGIGAVTIYNGFAVDAPAGDRGAARDVLGLAAADRLVVHPVRAIARKDVPAAVAVAGHLDAHYWLLGPAEEGYDHELAATLAAAPGPVHRGLHGMAVADAYAAADAVVFPSTWEGFGNPTVEAAIHRRPLALRLYPVARELARFGFRWFDVDDPADLEALDRFLDQPDADLLDHNQAVARTHFSVERMARGLARVVADLLPTAPLRP